MAATAESSGLDDGTPVDFAIDQRTFERFRALVYAQSGIYLRDGKQTLLRARIARRMRHFGVRKPADYLKLVEADTSGEELVELLNAVSTNVTAFYREPEHFVALRQRVAAWAAAGQRRFRFWSAACSTGEEPYTMALELGELLGDRCDYRILATDISTRVLDVCARGVYPKERVDPVPAELRRRFSRAGADDRGRPLYRIDAALQRRVLFKRLNLSSTPYPMNGPLDAVFCRNVMIYFDNAGRRKILGEIKRLLKPDGLLFVGHAESLAGMLGDFTSVQPAIYVKRG